MLNDPNFKFKSFIPPGLVKGGDKLYVCPGWMEVPAGTTLEEVKLHWEQELPKAEEKPAYVIEELVPSSRGKGLEYTVKFDGLWWSCDCTGFGFKRTCRHVDQIKLKHKVK